jgi:hypothetical protein
MFPEGFKTIAELGGLVWLFVPTFQNLNCLTDFDKFWYRLSTPITGHAGPEGSWRVKAPRFLDIGTIWW